MKLKEGIFYRINQLVKCKMLSVPHSAAFLLGVVANILR
jgi:hypothetical protein